MQGYHLLETDLALKGIGDDKAPGLDGFNALFFKNSWHIIKALFMR